MCSEADFDLGFVVNFAGFGEGLGLGEVTMAVLTSMFGGLSAWPISLCGLVGSSSCALLSSGCDMLSSDLALRGSRGELWAESVEACCGEVADGRTGFLQ